MKTFFLLYPRNMTAMILRELNARYGSKPGGYLWAFFDPISYIGLMTLMRGALGTTPPMGDSVAIFIASGYIGYYAYNATSAYVAQAIRGNKALLSYPSIAPFDAVSARFVLQILTLVGVAICIFYVASFTTLRMPSMNFEVMIEAGLATSLFGLGVGLCNIALFARSSLYEKVFGIMMRPMFLLSGVFMLPDEVPEPFQTYMLYNPVVHFVMWFRSGVFPDYRADLLNIDYAMTWMIGALFAGLTLFTANIRTIREA